MYQFVLAMVLALYVGFSRLHHLQFLAREPMLMGILKVLRLAAAVYLLAFSGFLAWECRAAGTGNKSVTVGAERKRNAVRCSRHRRSSV
jgi:hypothetical protein